MSEITYEELKAAMRTNGKIEDVVVLIPHNHSQRTYYRMCAFSHTIHTLDQLKAGARSVCLFADDNIWLFLANGHPKAKECGAREVWKCDITYRGNHWDDEQTGSRYWVDVFTVHPKERLEKWS